MFFNNTTFATFHLERDKRFKKVLVTHRTAVRTHTTVNNNLNSDIHYTDDNEAKRYSCHQCFAPLSDMCSYLVVLDRKEHEAPGVLNEERLGLEAAVDFFSSHF